MADTKTTGLTEATVVDAGADFLPIVDVSDTSMAASGTTKKAKPHTLIRGATDANRNTFWGTNGSASSTGQGNVTIGYTAGEDLTVGNENTLIGQYAGASLAGSGNVNSPPISLSPGRHTVQVSGDLNGGTLTLYERTSIASPTSAGSYVSLGACPVGSTHFQAAESQYYLGFVGSAATFTAQIVKAEPSVQQQPKLVGDTAVS